MPIPFEIEQPYSEVSSGESRKTQDSGMFKLLPPGTGPRSRLHGLRYWTGAAYAQEFWNWARCKHLPLPNVAQLSKALSALDGASSKKNTREDTEAPIFLLGNGWRTGSTLLQRILVTDQRLMLWGEPFGEMAFISAMAETLTRLATFPDLRKYRVEDGLRASPETSGLMAKSWIATLYTEGEDLRAAMRSLLSVWLGAPAAERGYSRWGFKEVRLGATEATLLHWLYPNARFVILSRHPFDCYRSLADSGWHHVYYRRPDFRVDSAAGFARHWNRLALSWLELPEGFPSVHIRYEDLIKSKVNFRELESWLGVAIKEDVALSAPVGHTAMRGKLTWYERFIIAREAATGMRAMGYSI